MLMPEKKASFPLRFEVRVLLPILAIMALLLFATLWIVKERFNDRVQTETEASLTRADRVFRAVHQQRERYLVERYVNVANEPRVKGIATLGDRKTAADFIAKYRLEELGGGAILISRSSGEILAGAASDPSIRLEELEPYLATTIKAALAGEPVTSTIRAAASFFEVVSVPIRTDGEPGAGGVLTFVDRLKPEAAWDFKQLTGKEVVLFANSDIMASTLAGSGHEQAFIRVFREFSAANHGTRLALPGWIQPAPLDLGDDRFQVLAGQLPSSDGVVPGYLLLSSYKEPIRVLRDTQRVLIGVGVAGMILSSVIIWILVYRIAQPLRLLREGADAVGRGDFEHRVLVTSRDECGALATAFNQMTDNLRTSRGQLEQTVETLKTTRAQLLQSEKLSAIGEFVAGVTHELNNPLTAVIGFADLMKQMGASERQSIYIDNIVNSAQRCHKIVQSLLSFARQYTPEKKPADVNELIENTLNFVQYEFRTGNIALHRQLAPNLPRVWADPNQLQQVFLNIVNNARHAIEDSRREGTLTVVTEVAGDFVRVSFRDTGPGISAANIAKIFNPFFTTKAVGKGTGLGLSVSYGIIQEHGGSIRVESQVGEGATFIIELPILRGEPSVQATTSAVPAVRPARSASGKRILVVDDEPHILELVESGLTLEGHQVDAVGDGEAALSLFRSHRYDLILCDWKMPGLNGQQVYERIKALDPGACRRIVFMTGDVVSGQIRAFHEEAGAACLSKPFTLEQLRRITYEALGKD